MKKRFIIGITLFVLGTMFSTAKANKPGFFYHPYGKHHHHREIRHDKRELKKDRMVRDYHLRHGHYGMAAKKQHEINHDRRELRHDKRHGHGHRHHRHHHRHN